MLKKDAREPYKEIGVAQYFQGLRRFCFQTRDYRQSDIYNKWNMPFKKCKIHFNISKSTIYSQIVVKKRRNELGNNGCIYMIDECELYQPTF